MANRRDVASPVLMRLESESAQVVRLDRPLTIVGSKLHSHLRIVSQAISGSHALLLNLGNHVFVRDLMSRTHVFVNDRQVTEAQFKYGDVLRFGEMRFRFADTDVVRPSLARIRSEPARLHLPGRPDPVVVEAPLFVFGRQKGADMVLESSRVSKAHAVLYMQAGGWMLRDLGSREGTLVNGTPIRAMALTGGEAVRIGRTSFTFEAPKTRENGVDGELVASDGAVADQPAAEESEREHVFVEEPAIVIDAPGEIDELPPRTEVVENLAQERIAGAVKGLELGDPATLGEAAAPIWEFNIGGATVPLSPPQADDRVEDMRDLVDWGVVAESAPPSGEVALPEDNTPAAPLAGTPSGLLAEVEAVYSDGRHLSAPASELPAAHAQLPVADPVVAPRPDLRPLDSIPADAPSDLEDAGQSDPGTVLAYQGKAGNWVPMGLSEPVDLETPSSPPGPAPAPQSEPTTSSTQPDPLGEIVGDQVLTLYGEDRAAADASAKPASRRRRRSRSAMLVTVGAALFAIVAAAAGGAWFYIHRS
jgi:pSer/pThr/pTyr-binding forkhead associated (FHA) protein